MSQEKHEDTNGEESTEDPPRPFLLYNHTMTFRAARVRLMMTETMTHALQRDREGWVVDMQANGCNTFMENARSHCSM